ncbi:MAG: DUF6514 family protein [Cellulosilyticaceae bacterium]
MVMEKVFIGEQWIDEMSIRYYSIQKDCFYGVAVEEDHKDTIKCHQTFFTESKNEAQTLGKVIYRGIVTGMTLDEVIDDFVQ